MARLVLYIFKPGVDGARNLDFLHNNLLPATRIYVADCSSHTDAIRTPKKVVVKPLNGGFARYQFVPHKRETGQKFDRYFQATTAEQNE